MRIVLCTLVLAFLLVSSNGCQLFEKKNSGSSGDGPFLGAKTTDKPKAGQPNDPLAGAAASSADMDGIIAGRVIDAMGQPADARIRWVCLDDAKADGDPIYVPSDSQGYFMIQGLKSGKHYQLTTSAKSGDKTLEVKTLTQAPNIHLLISVNDRFAVPAAPDKGKGKKSADSTKEQPASAQSPTLGQGWQQQSPTMLPPVEPIADKTKIVELGAIKPPIVSTPGPGEKNAGSGAAIGPIGKAGPSPYSVPPGPAPLGSSLRYGDKIENFVLNDLSLQPWEFKKERRGKVVLLDFWKTNCVPCLQTIPELRILQNEYASRGLEIIGIAYEDSGRPQEQAYNVAKVADHKQAYYQILLGGGQTCKLKSDLNVRGFPTLVLLDERGAIVWQHEGLLDASSKTELRLAIEQRLLPR